MCLTFVSIEQRLKKMRLLFYMRLKTFSNQLWSGILAREMSTDQGRWQCSLAGKVTACLAILPITLVVQLQQSV